MRLQKPQILVSLTHDFGQQVGSAFVAVLSILPVVVHVARFYFSQGLPRGRKPQEARLIKCREFVS